ncbi:MAG: AMP-binding protein, partial [Clostridia bacterium]|nr:AMP-binding protein [Clostridia bacterium]
CSAHTLAKVRECVSNLKTVRFVFCFDDPGDGDEEYTADLLVKGRLLLSDGYTEYVRARLSTDKMCTLLFTSGTTGTSKGVMLSQNNLTACVYHSANMVDVHEGDVLLSVLPMHHTYELVCGQLGAICLGATVCFNNGLKYFMRNLKLFRLTAMIVVPAFVTSVYRKVRDEIEKKRFHRALNIGVRVTSAVDHVGLNLGSLLFHQVRKGLGGRLRTVICGGAALNPELVDKFGQFGIRVCQGYGITECSPLVCVVPYTSMRKGSVGLPAYGTQVRIVGTEEDGREVDLPPHVIGEIQVRSEQVMLGYYLNQKATKAAMTADGYFRSGDYGYIDDDGYLYITGRKKNIIILSNGKNVYPEVLEEYLYENDLVKDCVVLARPQEEGDAVITAVILPDFSRLEGKTDPEIVRTFREIVADPNRRLPTFKQIRNVELRKTEFEKTTTQKIQRHKV